MKTLILALLVAALTIPAALTSPASASAFTCTNGTGWTSQMTATNAMASAALRADKFGDEKTAMAEANRAWKIGSKSQIPCDPVQRNARAHLLIAYGDYYTAFWSKQGGGRKVALYWLAQASHELGLAGALLR